MPHASGVKPFVKVMVQGGEEAALPSGSVREDRGVVPEQNSGFGTQPL